MSETAKKLSPTSKLNTPQNNTLKIEKSDMCYRRRRRGRGFQYLDEHGATIKDKAVLKRIKQLVIPPMWKKVKICKYDRGYLQATGRDLKNRKQYIYHADWEKKRQAKKFTKLKKFGKRLPRFREYCTEMVQQMGWTREKVLSLMILILDETGIRIGNRQYANRNGTFGLSTLRRKHMNLEGDELIFEYQGKSKKSREVTIDDEELIRFIKQSAEQPGYEIFRYRDENGDWQSVDSSDLNEFIQDHLGKKFSSKDFRTWVASRLAVELYPYALEKAAEKTTREVAPTLIKLVANELGNTPSVCRTYYVHPKIQKAVSKGKLSILDDDSETLKAEHSKAEEIVLAII